MAVCTSPNVILGGGGGDGGGGGGDGVDTTAILTDTGRHWYAAD